VSRALAVGPVNADDRHVVSYRATSANYIVFRVFLSEVVFDEKVFRVIRKAFMDPHVGRVFHRDVVAEPLVRRFVNNDEVELKADATGARISRQIAVAKPVAVSY